MVGGAIWTMVRKPWGMLAASLLAYHWSERALGVGPLKLYELTDVLGQNKEASIAAAALVVAIVSVSAFRRVKRLDLELAAAADIKEIIRDGQELLSRNRLYCEELLRLHRMYQDSHGGSLSNITDRNKARRTLPLVWQSLSRSAERTRQDRTEIWKLMQRINDLSIRHSAILHSKIMAPLLLERAQRHLEAIADSALFPVPGSDELGDVFIRAYTLDDKERTIRYLEVDKTRRSGLFECLGGASSLGASSVALPSVVTTIRMAKKVCSTELRE